MSKDRWAATAVPGIRRAMVRGLARESDRMDALAARAATIDRQGEADSLTVGAASVRQLAGSLDMADLFWVTRPMAQVAMDASHDVPGVDWVDIPSPHGMMLFSDHLPAVALPEPVTLRTDHGMVDSDDPIPVDAIAWRHAGVGRLTIEMLVRTTRLPAPIHGVDVPLTAFGTMTAPVPVMLDGMELAVPDDQGELRRVPGSPRQLSAVVAFLSACWVLMMTPTVAERKSLDGRWGGRATGQSRPGDLVTAVDLRPLRYVRTDTDSSGRQLTTRHIVRGHWTHQPFGHERARRRLQWIAPYVRGPEGAPLVQTEKVMVWRR